MGSMQARAAAHESWARTVDRTARTAKARLAAEERFYEATDPSLPERVRRQQAEAARKAHFARLAAKSAKARRRSRS